MSNSTFLKKGEYDASIIGHRITGINFEIAHPIGFNLIIRVRISNVEKCNWFFCYERENLNFLKPMELLGKEIKCVEYHTEGNESGIKITVADGCYIWLKQI